MGKLEIVKPYHPQVRRRLHDALQSLRAWWTHRKKLSSGYPFPPAPAPVNIILKGGPAHNKTIDGVVGHSIGVPVHRGDHWMLPGQAFPVRPAFGQVVYLRTTEVLKNGRVVFRPKKDPMKVRMTIAVGDAIPMWFTMDLSGELAEPIIATIKGAQARNGLNGIPPTEITGPLNDAVFAMHQACLRSGLRPK
jgi:hypothetical protein